MLAAKLLSASGGPEQIFSDDVFSVTTYTGNGSTQTITNGIDLAGKGGLVWTKTRVDTLGIGGTNIYHHLVDSERGIGKWLVSNTTNAQQDYSYIGSFNQTGYSISGGRSEINANSNTYVSWTFRNADKFYNHAVVTKSSGSNATVSFANLGTLGMVRVKRTDSTGSWYIWHRSLSAGQLLIGETTAAAATLGHVTVSGTTVTLVNAVIADGTYLVEAFAHDTSADGIIQCGSFTTDGSGNATVNLGWEPQFVIYKTTTEASEWWMADTMRGASQTSTAGLRANTSAEEAPNTTYYIVKPNAQGFSINAGAFSKPLIYLAIRRPNKPPTTGTQVYNAIARTGTGAAATVTGVGFATDLSIIKSRTGTEVPGWYDRLRGKTLQLVSSSNTTTEQTFAQSVTGFDKMDGITIGNSSAGDGVNVSGRTYINWFFRRAQGEFDVVCYTGTGANKTEAHNLGNAPELWLAKRRNAAGSWVFGSSLLGANEKIVIPPPSGGRVTDTTAWNSTYPTTSNISLGTLTDVNASGGTYAAYLWATLAGVSKVFTYTGNGSSQTIDCGFAAGARFVLIIRATASTAQDIFIWDTARGIIAGNDPRLSLNTTAAEVTSLDTIDPASSGFIVNQDSSNVNVNGAVYIGLAYA